MTLGGLPELSKIVGLGEVIVHACIKASFFVFLGRMGSERYARRASGGTILPTANDLEFLRP
jgi:hypothetical protein